MKVRSSRRLTGELGVVLGQILLVEIAVRRLVIGNALPSPCPPTPMSKTVSRSEVVSLMAFFLLFVSEVIGLS